MAMDAAWSNEEKTILNVRIYGTVSWDQYHNVCVKATEMIKSVPHRVDVIFTPEVDVPPGNPLPHFKSASLRLQTAENLGYCISVVPSSIPLARVFMALIFRVYGISSKFQNVYTLEEAYRIIAEARGQSTSV